MTMIYPLRARLAPHHLQSSHHSKNSHHSQTRASRELSDRPFNVCLHVSGAERRSIKALRLFGTGSAKIDA
jgi:hypothetical protein